MTHFDLREMTIFQNFHKTFGLANEAFQHFENEDFTVVSANQPKPLKVTKSGCSYKNSLPAPFLGTFNYF